jgi:hypothetical protein
MVNHRINSINGRNLSLFLVVLFCLLLLTGCDKPVSSEPIDSLEDLAYDVSGLEDCIVYLEEKSGFQPYLVLSEDYGGNVLLQRKYLLDEVMPFTRNDTHFWSSNDWGGYYENSTIDKYLNDDFIQSFSEEFQATIVTSDIEIASKSNWYGGSGEDVNAIARKIFLLSLYELNSAQSSFGYTAVAEGCHLTYFDGKHTRRIASFSDGTQCPYWTRSPAIWETYTVFTIGVNAVGVGSAEIKSGVRPALCLESGTAITQRTDVMDGQTVYVLDIGNN